MKLGGKKNVEENYIHYVMSQLHLQHNRRVDAAEIIAINEHLLKKK